MRGLALDFRGRTTLFVLLAIIAAIYSTSSFFSLSHQPGRLHARALGPQVHVTERHARPLVPRVPVLVTKPASAAEYAKAASKGQVLMCWMRNPALAGDQATSHATKWEQLEEWGWTSSGSAPVIGPNYSQETDAGIKALVGIEWSGGNRAMLAHTKDHDPIKKGKKSYSYPATFGNYDNRFFHKHGVIVADSNWSPAFNVEYQQVYGWDNNSKRLPLVNRLSDIWWLVWAKLCSDTGTEPSTLKYIVQKSVVNWDTQGVLASVIQKHWAGETEVDAGRVPEWPGKVITNDMDGFAALVGTPNIWGSAYLAIQRSDTLGKKQIKSITAWNGYPDIDLYQPNMIVELEDVVEDEPEDEPDEE